MKYSLPESAEDLLIKDGKLLMRSLSIYEVLRRFAHIIRLTPFRFEDFCAALLNEEQSPLLAEIHLQLLRTLMREDRQQQTWLGPPDLKDSVNVYLQLADHTNWPAALKIYLSADTKENSSILSKLSRSSEALNYPFNVTLEVKLDVLEQLTDHFLQSNLAREEIVNVNNSVTKHDNICRMCSKANGDLVACDTCPAVYHLKCSDPPLENYPNLKNGDETYSCSVCKSNEVVGVVGCIDSEEKSGNFKRHESLGSDKLGRNYWFLVRRIFVVDELEDDVRYYTNQAQFNDLIDRLKENRHEKDLVDSILNQKDEISRQMKITEDLYTSLLKDHKNEDGSYSKFLGEDGTHRGYTNQYSSNNLAFGKNQHSDRDINRSLNNKFSMNSCNSFKWSGAINGNLTSLTTAVRATILKFETTLPQTFMHPCWKTQRPKWIRKVNYVTTPEEYAIALSHLEANIRPVLFKPAWFDGVGFCQLFRSTSAEREELKKTDRQPRGFERKEWFSQDFELSYRLGTMVKFSSKLKPVKHQVWKQKGEEYRITGLNAWCWRSCTFKSRPRRKDPSNSNAAIKNGTKFNIDNLIDTLKKSQENETPTKKTFIVKPKSPPCHNFLTKRGKIRSILILPDLELHKLARAGGLRENKSFSYAAKQNSYVWPYGMTPRPVFKTCWLFKNRTIDTIQEVALQLKVMYACIRWDDLQVRPPASGRNVIVTDEASVTIELLKKRDKLPYLTKSEYLIKKIITPIEQPTKYRKIGSKKSTPSARSGLRARRQTDEDEDKGPTTEELWVGEDQLELWELKQFDEKIERQNQLMREKALREEAERRRKVEEERRRKLELERKRRVEEEARKVRLSLGVNASGPSTPQTLKPNIININQPRSLPTTPVVRYFRTEQGQIIRLPASYLERGTPLILRHVGPGPNQTNTYIIRPQITQVTTNTVVSNTACTPTVVDKPATPATLVTPTTPAAQPASTLPASPIVQPTPPDSAESNASSTHVTPATPADSAPSTAPTTSSDSAAPTTQPESTGPLAPASAAPLPAPAPLSDKPIVPAESSTLSTPATPVTQNIPTEPIVPSMPDITAAPSVIDTPAIATTSDTPIAPASAAVHIAAEDVTAAAATTTQANDCAVKQEAAAATPAAHSAEKAEAIVGTVVNELAHDQHAPDT